MRIILTALLTIFLATPAAWADTVAAQGEEVPTDVADFQAGREFTVLPAPHVLVGKDDGRIEVVAFFWYNCGTCYYVEPDITAWAEKLPRDVRFIRLPFTYKPLLDVHARIFFALQKMGLGHEADLAVFKLFQDDRQPVNDPAQLPVLAEALKIDKDKLIAAYHSPEVAAQMTQLKKILQRYDLQGVPSMVINGRYSFDIGTAHGPTNYLKLADRLIAEERQALKAGKKK